MIREARERDALTTLSCRKFLVFEEHGGNFRRVRSAGRIFLDGQVVGGVVDFISVGLDGQTTRLCVAAAIV